MRHEHECRGGPPNRHSNSCSNYHLKCSSACHHYEIPAIKVLGTITSSLHHLNADASADFDVMRSAKVSNTRKSRPDFISIYRYNMSLDECGMSLRTPSTSSGGLPHRTQCKPLAVSIALSRTRSFSLRSVRVARFRSFHMVNLSTDEMHQFETSCRNSIDCRSTKTTTEIRTWR